MEDGREGFWLFLVSFSFPTTHYPNAKGFASMIELVQQAGHGSA